MPLFKKTRGLPEGGDIILNKLKEVSFFSMFENDMEVLGKISSICSRRQYRKGKMIIREGDFGDELFIILNGEIDIIKNTL